jgi:hypothetical protein
MKLHSNQGSLGTFRLKHFAEHKCTPGCGARADWESKSTSWLNMCPVRWAHIQRTPTEWYCGLQADELQLPCQSTTLCTQVCSQRASRPASIRGTQSMVAPSTSHDSQATSMCGFSVLKMQPFQVLTDCPWPRRHASDRPRNGTTSSQ